MSAGPVRVLQVIDTMETGGAQRLVTRLAGMASASPAVEISVVALRPTDDRTLLRELEAMGTVVRCIPPRSRHHLLDLTTLTRLARVTLHHDVVQCHLGAATVFGVAAARATRRPGLVTLHTTKRSRPAWGGGRLRHRIADLALRHGPDHVVAVGPSVRAAHADRVGQRSTSVITNPAPPVCPVTAAERDAARRQLVGSVGDVVVAVGRIEPEKGLDVLLESLALLAKDGRCPVLLIAGEGSARRDLERRAAELDIAGYVRFLGQTADVRSVLAAGDVFVSSSRREGMPMAVLEAMSAGLPVLATDVGDVRETVSTAGVVIPPEDPRRLAEAIAFLLRDGEERRRLGEEAARLAGTRYDEEEWFRQWLDLWTAMANGARQDTHHASSER